MKRFRFSLQTVLQVRQWREEQLQAEWGQALRQARSARQRLEEENGRWEQAAAQWRTLNDTGASDPQWWYSHQRHTERVRRKVQHAYETWRAADTLSQSVRERVVEAARSRRTLEMLRDEEARRHRQAFERREIARLDEVSALRYWQSGGPSA